MAKDAVDQLATTLNERMLQIAHGDAVDVDKHRENMERRRKEREAKRELQEQCLNPEFAAKCELEKPRREFSVHARFMAHGDKGMLVPMEHSATVVALNEDDAWARFCDQIRVWPGRRACSVLTITKGREISIAEFAAAEQCKPRGNSLASNY
jgi:hypothetical protein